jgi:ATP-binding cassette, subfamily C (CFTR/MRP), member 1
LINAYLLLTLPLDIAQVRTQWLRGSTDRAVVSTITIAVKLVLLVAEAINKRSDLFPAFANSPAETVSGLYSRATFWWLNPLFLFGYSKVIALDTLADIDNALLSRPIYRRFRLSWPNRAPKAENATEASSDAAGSYKLVFTMFRVALKPLLAAIPPRLLIVFFRFMQPFLIRRTSSVVALPPDEYTTNLGWGLTGAYGLVYFGLAVSPTRREYVFPADKQSFLRRFTITRTTARRRWSAAPS